MNAACLAGASAIVLSSAAACSSGSSSPSPSQSVVTKNTSIAVASPKAGGSLTVLEGKGFSGDWPLGLETTQALAQEWAAVGIKTTLHVYPLNGLINAFLANSGKRWQSMIATAGAYDPAGGVGVGFRFLSTSPFSGVHDPRSTRCPLYNQAAAYIAKNFYGPFYFSFAPANVSVKGVGGPGLTSPLPAVSVTPAILWESVYYNPAGA